MRLLAYIVLALASAGCTATAPAGEEATPTAEVATHPADSAPAASLPPPVAAPAFVELAAMEPWKASGDILTKRVDFYVVGVGNEGAAGLDDFRARLPNGTHLGPARGNWTILFVDAKRDVSPPAVAVMDYGWGPLDASNPLPVTLRDDRIYRVALVYEAPPGTEEPTSYDAVTSVWESFEPGGDRIDHDRVVGNGYRGIIDIGCGERRDVPPDQMPTGHIAVFNVRNLYEEPVTVGIAHGLSVGLSTDDDNPACCGPPPRLQVPPGGREAYSCDVDPDAREAEGVTTYGAVRIYAPDYLDAGPVQFAKLWHGPMLVFDVTVDEFGDLTVEQNL